MNQEDVQKLSNAANAKITLLKNDFFKYFMRAIMAGFFIVVAMIFSNVVGNVFSGAEEPAWGKFLGALVFSIAVLLIFVWAGASGTADYFAGFIGNKLAIPAGQMFFRAVLCNFFVCLGVLCGIKLKSEAAKFLMIVMCISGFVVSGFEHCVANMGIFVTAGCLVPGVSIGAMVKSMIIVTLGNMAGGALLLAWPLRKMSADK